MQGIFTAAILPSTVLATFPSLYSERGTSRCLHHHHPVALSIHASHAPITTSTRAFHHPPTPFSFDLSPYMQNTHPQWFDPANRQCCFAQCYLPKSSLWWQHKQRSSGYYKAHSSCLHIPQPNSTRVGRAVEYVDSCSGLCSICLTSVCAATKVTHSGAVWRSTSSEAPSQFSIAVSQAKLYTTPACQSCSSWDFDDAGQPAEPACIISTGPATATAIWAPFPAVGIYPATDLPTTVISLPPQSQRKTPCTVVRHPLRWHSILLHRLCLHHG